MFKQHLTITLLILIITPSLQTPLQAATYCIGNCYQCPINPKQCPYIQSLLYSPANHNCLPYSIGRDCKGSAYGLQAQLIDGLADWSDGKNTVPRRTCDIYYYPGVNFNSMGPLTGGTTISKNIKLNQQTIQVLVFKMSFTFLSSTTLINSSTSTSTSTNTTTPTDNTETLPPINEDGSFNPQIQTGQITINNTSRVGNRTQRAFVDVRITGFNLTYTLQLNYPTITDPNQIVNTTCGLHFQYVKSIDLNQSIPAFNSNINVQIISIGSPATTWGLNKFEVYTGCGGLMIPSGSTKCGACLNGYYPIVNQPDVLMGCAPCPQNCKTCTQDRCTLCQSGSEPNPTTFKCQYSQYYINIPSYIINQGFKLENPPQLAANYYQTIIGTDRKTNKIRLQTELTSTSPYAIKFSLIYPSSFVVSLKQRQVKISRGSQVLMAIPARDFMTEVGMYDLRLSTQRKKYYVKSIYIDRLNEQNLQKTLQITVEAPAEAETLYISRYTVTQYQCSPRCSKCDRINNVCLECTGFFINHGSLGCKNCANGYYLKSSYSLQVAQPITPENDICIKCHSSCMQCLGPGMDHCTACYNLFFLDSITYDQQCITCLYNAKNKPSEPIPEMCTKCISYFKPDIIFNNQECAGCIKDRKLEDITTGQQCRSCWITNGLSSGRCVPTPVSALAFYGSDVTGGVIDKTSWSSIGGLLKELKCSADYTDLWGVDNVNNNNNVTIQYKQDNLPSHTGLYLVVNIYKTDTRLINQQDGTRKGQKIYIKIKNGLSQQIQLTLKKSGINYTPGSNICKDNSNQMIHTYIYDAPKHSDQTFEFSISSEGGGIYVRQLELYLGNCPDCVKNQLNYQINYLPRYPYNSNVSSGIDVWINFNQKVIDNGNTNFKNAFKFEIDQLPHTKLQPKQFVNQLKLNNRLKYYLPIDTTFNDGTLKVRTSPDARIFGSTNTNGLQFSRRMLINSPLNILSSQQIIQRFSKLSVDDSFSTTQIYNFFNFFQWFGLITMIVCIMLGVGVVFEEFSILLQLLFLHVYISSATLPATYKAPLVGLERMENLNYFANPHAASIQSQWFGNYQHPSPYVFQQYNKDIFFQRSFYPTIIINIIYLLWFIILLVCYKLIPKFQASTSNFIGFFRNIPARPLNFIDQIWRYQFITTMWSAFMQFHILKNDTVLQRLNLALCFISFIISIIWPFFVVCYTYRLNSIKYTSDFMYKYQDIYFKKIETISQSKIKYYYYIFIRFLRYLIMALFICVFTDHEIIAPVILICINIIQIVYVVGMRIYYNSFLGVLFKVAENLLFIGVEVALLFANGLAGTAKDRDFLNLGHAINVMYVIMVILGILRVIYLIYEKAQNFKYNTRLGIDNGEIVNVGPTPLPNTERDQPNNQFK